MYLHGIFITAVLWCVLSLVWVLLWLLLLFSFYLLSENRFKTVFTWPEFSQHWKTSHLKKVWRLHANNEDTIAKSLSFFLVFKYFHVFFVATHTHAAQIKRTCSISEYLPSHIWYQYKIPSLKLFFCMVDWISLVAQSFCFPFCNAFYLIFFHFCYSRALYAHICWSSERTWLYEGFEGPCFIFDSSRRS